MPRSTAQLRALWGPPCGIRKITISLYGSGRVTVDWRIRDAVYALNRVLAKYHYPTRYADTGGYVCRQITGGSGYSLHAYGTAVDLNWTSNPYGPRLITDMPRAMVEDIKAIRTNNGAEVWGWGGDFAGSKDAMHFQIVASPQELSHGIRAGGLGSQLTDEEFRMDAEAKAAFAALNKRLDEMEEDRLRPTTIRVRELAERLEVLEKDRLEPTTRRVREIHEKVVG